MTTILGKIRLLRTTAAAVAAEVLEEGRLAYLTDENTLVSGDGVTAGASLKRIASLTLLGNLNINGYTIVNGAVSMMKPGAGSNSLIFGAAGTAAGDNSISAMLGTADGDYCVAMGSLVKAGEDFTLATGNSSHARLKGSHAHAAFSYGPFTQGASQCITVQIGRTTTNATPATLTLDGSTPGADDYFAVPSGYVISGVVHILGVKSDGSEAAHYTRQFTIKNVGGTTALVGAVQVVGVDVEDDANWDIAITADDTNDAVAITVTGVADTTIRWIARFTGVEMAYGT